MTAVTEPGTLARAGDDSLRIEAGGESYRLEAKEVRSLLAYGRIVPITRGRQGPSAGGKEETEPVSIEGHAAISRGGKAVLLYTRAGHFIVPLVSFSRVARGEAVSAPLFPLVPDWQDGPA
ncbi:MAG: hypothetical protein QHH04_09660 [Methanolinea sp.]|nr:hypothetical protein [Methanolinea sp.]